MEEMWMEPEDCGVWSERALIIDLNIHFACLQIYVFALGMTVYSAADFRLPAHQVCNLYVI